MDRNLSFFLNAFKPSSNDTSKNVNANNNISANNTASSNKFDSRTGLPTNDYSYKLINKHINENNTETIISEQDVPVKALKSIMTNNKFVNYKGINTFNEPGINPFDESLTDDSWASIIEFTNKYETYALKPADLSYIKNVLTLPPNRLIVLRRFGNNPIPNDIINSNFNISPTSTLCGFIMPDKPTIKLGFNEKWVSESDTLLDIINDMIGLKDKKLPTIPGETNLDQVFLQQVSNNLGLGIDFIGPMGNPNIVNQAYTRKTNSTGEKDGWESGLEFDLSLEFETTYEMQYIKGVDPGVAMLDIIANITEMGTSDAEFILSGSGASAANKILKFLQNPNSKELIYEVINAIKNAVLFLVNKIKSFLVNAATATKDIATNSLNAGKKGAKSKNSDGSEKNVVEKVVSGAIEAGKQVVDDLLSIVSPTIDNMIHDLFRKYQWKIRGSIYAMTGAPSAPWHITMGNPKNPFFICGNLVCKKVEMELNGEFGFNDMPTQINVKIQLIPARPLGKSEIQQLFNGGSIRIHEKQLFQHQIIKYR